MQAAKVADNDRPPNNKGSGMRNRAVHLLVCASVFVATTGARAVELQQSVSYTDQSGHIWCAKVRYVEKGHDGRPWAWLTIDADPRRIMHAPVAELVIGCK